MICSNKRSFFFCIDLHLLFDKDQTQHCCGTTGVKSILEISATDKIHMEDRNHGLARTKPNNGICNMLNRLPCRTSFIWMMWCHRAWETYKLDQIAARNLKSVSRAMYTFPGDGLLTFLEVKLRRLRKKKRTMTNNMISVIRIYLLLANEFLWAPWCSLDKQTTFTFLQF